MIKTEIETLQLKKLTPFPGNPQEEKWLDIKGYEGIYKISSHGRIKSFHGLKPKILKDRIERCGYVQSRLCGKGKEKHLMRHRLVAEAFIPNPYGYPEINHKDFNKQNNHVDNLEWCTSGMNQAHTYRHGIRTNKGGNNPNAKLTKEIVKLIRESTTVKPKEFANILNVNINTIRQIIRFKTWVYV